MPFTSRRGHLIHYRVHGDPRHPPLLLLMGLGLSSAAWGELPGKLSRWFRVVVLDNRGCGHSGLPNGPYAIATLADDAAAVLDAAGIGAANVCGISMGGMVAQELALRHPLRVRNLVLACTFASFLRAKKPTLRVVTELAQALGDELEHARFARFLVSEAFMATAGAHEAFSRWRVNAKRGRARRVLLQVLAIGLHSTWARLPQLSLPVLVLAGDRDRLVDVSESVALARRIPGARLRVFAGAGHVFPLEREQETISALCEQFLGAVPEGVLGPDSRPAREVPLHASAAG